MRFVKSLKVANKIFAYAHMSENLQISEDGLEGDIDRRKAKMRKYSSRLFFFDQKYSSRL